MFRTFGKICGVVLPFALVWYGSDYLLRPELPQEFVVVAAATKTDAGSKSATAAAAAEPKAEKPPQPQHQLGGPFGTIVDCASGQPVDHVNVFGGPRWSLLYFGFARCAEVCPRNLNFLARVVQAADAKLAAEGNGGKLQIVFVSVDPLRDSPEALNAYLSQRVPAGVPWRGLCGSEEQVASIAKAWRVYYSSVSETESERAAREAKGVAEDSSTYQLDHSAAVYFVAPGGQLRDLFFDEMGVNHAVTRIDLHLSNMYGFDDDKEKRRA